MPLATRVVSPERVAVPILAAISVSHLLNDLIQSLLPAIYPILKRDFNLDFGQIGFLTLTFQLTASLLQPMIGTFTDRKPQPFSLVVGMGFTLIGLLTLSQASSYPVLLLAAALIGMGSSVFHPESSRVARLASGGRHGLAQSVFQVGGNAGSALGPLLAAFIVVPFGQPSIAWFSAVALLAIMILFAVGRWYQAKLADLRAKPRMVETGSVFSKRRIVISLAILVLLIFSKDFYVASFTNYFTFYLISKFHLPVQDAQVHLFIFLGSLAVGTLLGGPLGDRVGRRYVIWFSILGVLPFTLMLPFADLFWTTVLSMIIGVVLASAFSSIVVYAIELVPGRVGMISGFFFGFSFGMAGIGAAALGHLADVTSIGTVYAVCSFLPALGLLAYFLPKIERKHT
ncbi:MFS transporter [Microvirga lotononidis]|uniref:Arabinose efflux permease family protein n=1 Tax=Microvirga lotononidis TaxID=864069 RepID=I4YPS7_9HYPH|nr:MFS transporter [Microvirga lotononidis]EIM25969.1 arabinose efflux permease family protein [Microvirga lotononidis]WQO29828.1 MFS transporter [Microvirga lotononidis]